MEPISNLIPSNIISDVPTTLVLDNIDWKNKSIRGSGNKTHHTSCIQHKEHRQLKQEKSPVTPFIQITTTTEKLIVHLKQWKLTFQIKY